MRTCRAALLAAFLAALVMAGCGGSGDTTTVIKETPAETVERTTTVEVPADPPPEPVAKKAPKPKPAPEPEPEPGSRKAPNTIGLPLDIAEEMLEGAGFRVAATNTDTTFGILVPENYTICTQSPPRGNVVPVLAQKYGC